MDEPGLCPDPETLSAFMEGTLDKDVWHAVADHVNNCEDCLYVIGGSFAFERKREPQRSLIWLPLAAGLVVVIAAIVVLALQQRRDAIRRMSAAVQKSDARTFEGRVVNIGYARYVALRSAERNDPAMTAVVNGILRRATKPESANEWHVRGVAHLLVGQSSEAVAALAEAVRLDPSSSAYRSDLAAARIARGTEGGDSAEWRRALEDADAALRIKRTPEALFNRALALERLGDTAAAVTGYREYLTMDSSSRWSEEARWRLSRLSRPSR